MKISVVIPAFNSSDTIEECIHSVCQQSYLPYEIIVVDDGSNDDTYSKLELLVLQSSEITIVLLKQDNSGPSVARNKGVSVAKGDWIAFLDSDDHWRSDRLLNQVKFFEDNQNIGLIGSGDLGGLVSKEVTLSMLLKYNFFQTSAVLVKKSLVKEFPFNERQKYSEDYLCWLQICSKNRICVISPKSAHPINKNIVYSGGGLSSKLWKMEKGELSNYFYLYKNSMISFISLSKAVMFSMLKFIRRVIIIRTEKK